MVNIKDLKWDYSNPHILKFTIKESDIDILGHVNNKVYLNWCELVSWDPVSYTHLTLPTIA